MIETDHNSFKSLLPDILSGELHYRSKNYLQQS